MTYWAGGMSTCVYGGPIETFVNSLGHSIRINASDGLMSADDYDTALQQSPCDILAALCSRSLDTARRDRLLLLPLDDATFEYGLRGSFVRPLWDTRQPKVFWRGGASGYDKPSLRMRTVDALVDHPNSDVKLTRWGGWEVGKGIPETHFGARCSVQAHLFYKYLLIVDGNCIASNHQWVFASGSVPILVSHPENDFWFRKFVTPMVHYVPIKYDLSDLREKIDWLVANDAAAHSIAANACILADTIFTPEFQRDYIRCEVDRLIVH